MGDGREMDLIWPACEWRDECDPLLVAQQGPLAAALAVDAVAVQTPAGPSHVPRLGGQFTLDDRGNKWICVDLAVRMAQGDADRLASVLEHEHVPDVGEPAELRGAIAPDLDEVLDVIDGLCPKRRVVIGRVANHLTPPLVAGVGRKPIFEDGDVIVGLGDLRLFLASTCRAKGAMVCGRVIGAVLSPGSDGDPLLE